MEEKGGGEGDVGEEAEFSTQVLNTPSIRKDLAYRAPSERAPVLVAPQQGTMVRPDFADMLRRVSIVLEQHITKCEKRYERAASAGTLYVEDGLFHMRQGDKFAEEQFLSPQYKYHFVRVPLCRLGFMYGIAEVAREFAVPGVEEIHAFLSQLFTQAALSAECTIVCLVYVERLMEVGFVPLLRTTWRPVVMAGMLLASKVWQDLSSWNIEFAQIFPQYSITSINKLERLFCLEIKWDLYISTSSYAKYYFALRSLTEKRNFRQNIAVLAQVAPGDKQVSERSKGMKEGLLSTVLSRSL
jgi:hypothetical protein